MWSITRWILFLGLSLYLFCFTAYCHFRRNRPSSHMKPNASSRRLSYEVAAAQQHAQCCTQRGWKNSKGGVQFETHRKQSKKVWKKNPKTKFNLILDHGGHFVTRTITKSIDTQSFYCSGGSCNFLLYMHPSGLRLICHLVKLPEGDRVAKGLYSCNAWISTSIYYDLHRSAGRSYSACQSSFFHLFIFVVIFDWVMIVAPHGWYGIYSFCP